MVNAYYDFKNATPFTPYVGAGVGFAQASAKDVKEAGVTILDDDDGVFAYQLIGGVGYSIGPALTLDLMYKYVGTDDASMTATDGSSVEGEYQSHNVMIGLRFNY
jgi:opacity protein-like surface antigen